MYIDWVLGKSVDSYKVGFSILIIVYTIDSLQETSYMREMQLVNVLPTSR